jgi:putative protease
VAATKPELLAPAGNLASWAAALEAGADAVYLGLRNSRPGPLPPIFPWTTCRDWCRVTHERGAKIFVAFNSLLKDAELAQAAKLLDALTRIGPDALIIQDLGLSRLIRTHFPQFEIHASTLMADHNLPGLHVLAQRGFHRAVLARELTLDEIQRLTATAPPSLGLEVFIHGAMCFSFSGLCLMSSFLGGKGSLRGACTQPCRRRYTSGKKRGYFFSPTDLDASQVMARLRQMPLAALKIEGRMKGPEYVSRVVRAYRLLRDTPDADYEQAASEAENLLAESLGRHRSTGFFLSASAESGLSPVHAATSGLFLGQIVEGGSGSGRLALKEPLAVGDRIRIQFKSDDERHAHDGA